MANSTGRPSVIDENSVLKLSAAFRDGMTTTLACRLSGISRATYYKHLNEDERFSDIMTLSQQWVTERARQVIVRAIDKGNVQAAKWWLQRKARDEFGAKSEAESFTDEDSSSLAYLRQLVETANAAAELTGNRLN